MKNIKEEKKALIKHLRDARKAHRRWVSHAQTLMEGIPVGNEHLPINDTECAFGRWYYGEGQALRGYSVFRAIETHHQHLHNTYAKIFNILFNRKTSFFIRLLGKKAAPSEGEIAELRVLISELNEDSIRIMEGLDRLEKLIIDMDDKEFDSVYIT